ncbi:MAG: cytidine deaminase [Turneriella sp.]|nr:cytidine deaminase [Turneriella sp.]
MEFFASRINKKTIQQLRAAARHAARMAYAPYSQIHVGAALLASDGKVYTGANVENASYGLTLCAERVAVAAALQAVADNRHNLVRAIYIFNDALPAIPPCGACRQVLLEFGRAAWVIFEGKNGVKKMPLAKLLPHAFSL